MGAVGGGIWYGIKGARNSPRVCLAFFVSVTCPHTSLHDRENVLLEQYHP